MKGSQINENIRKLNAAVARKTNDANGDVNECECARK